ncbi:MAG: hypothetical protein GY822_22735 [Deltaproteobacteria bacterium]|nr:hypothetical protein [Deltaproteobacteria bacterium]
METMPTTGEEKDNRGIALGKVLRDRTSMPLDAFKEKYGCCFLLLQENSTRTPRRRSPTREMRFGSRTEDLKYSAFWFSAATLSSRKRFGRYSGIHAQLMQSRRPGT